MLNFNRPQNTNGNNGAPQAGGSGSGSRSDLPKATAWLNLGYTVPVQVSDGKGGTVTEDRFVSLPVGIPLDTMEPLAITTRNVEFGQFQAARNDMLEQLKAYAATLQPGEEQTISLEVQLRRVNDAAPVPAADASNPFSATLNFSSAASE